MGIPSLNLPVVDSSRTNSTLLNEVFGPTIQGEGPDMGKACFFVRTHGCPVKCPGCDTHYTWDGTEAGTHVDVGALQEKLIAQLQLHPGCGVVVSGGEPLLHAHNPHFRNFLEAIRGKVRWMGLETSGYVGREPVAQGWVKNYERFFSSFTTVCISPKITPCLHGQYTDEELLCNINMLRRCSVPGVTKNTYKFVVRDEADWAAVEKAVTLLNLPATHVMIMPYGTHREEIMEACEAMLPKLAQTGYQLTPRLHAILWGAKRGV